jgi:uncharacterized protein YunC (DUF1805 family)
MSMMKYKKVKVGKKYIEALALRLLTKNLIVLRGSKGFLMCGYLNLKVAEKFNDAAVIITGVSTIEEALCSTVAACTRAAKRLGVFKGQTVKEALALIA